MVYFPSSMAPTPTMANEDSIIEAIKKRLAKNGQEGITKAARLSEIVASLHRSVGKDLFSSLLNLLSFA